MKKLLILLLPLFVFSCEKEEETCECFYVTYTRPEGRNFGEASRHPWNDDSCENEVVSESFKITVDGTKVYTKIAKECE